MLLLKSMAKNNENIVSLAKKLAGVFEDCGKMTIAVSGGVDSMTLASFAQRQLGRERVKMIHALSPAVPKAATSRVKKQSEAENWDVELVDAGEFADEHYLSNPFNRCFFCKSNLYKTLSQISQGTLVSGTNSDDLQDFRPGLQAAEEHQVRHPFVEADFAKEDVRALARHLGLPELSQLPASPCLSSRVETGIRINNNDLEAIDKVETWIQDHYSPKTVRCRVLEEGIIIQLDTNTLEGLVLKNQKETVLKIKNIFHHRPEKGIRFERYQRGSAFLIPR